MRADRLLSALLLLQAHGRLSGRQLAARLEVSQRTVHRDMEALGAAGVPVYALRGARGGWQLEEGWRTRVPGLDEAELRGLLMAQPRLAGDPRLIAAAESALGKLMAALPATMRDKAASIRQRLHVDPTGWQGMTEDLSMLPIVQDAVARDRKLAFRYPRSGGGRGERTVDPLGLVAKGFAWYLVAHTAAGMRTFRVSRMAQVRLLDAAADRPAGFDLASHWQSSVAQLEQGQPHYCATFRLAPDAARTIGGWRTATRVAATDHDGWATFEVSFANADEACFVALGLGTRVDIVAPAALRAQVIAEGTAALARHQRPAVAGPAAARRQV